MQLLFRIMAVVGAGMFAGVLLAILVILGGFWRSLPLTGFQAQFAMDAKFIMRAIPLVLLPTLVGLGGAIWFDWGQGGVRSLWLLSAGCIVAVLGLTIVFFGPANAAFAAGSVPLDQVAAKRDLWLLVHGVRVLLAAGAAAAGLVAVARG